MIGNKKYHPTPEKQDGTTLNIRKTEKQGSYVFSKKRFP